MSSSSTKTAVSHLIFVAMDPDEDSDEAEDTIKVASIDLTSSDSLHLQRALPLKLLIPLTKPLNPRKALESSKASKSSEAPESSEALESSSEVIVFDGDLAAARAAR